MFKKLIFPSCLFFFTILEGQFYISADPFNLKFFEYSQFDSPTKNIKSTFIRPFFNDKADSILDIQFTNEYYFNNGLPNQENMDVRYLGKGSGKYLAYKLAYYGKFIAFVIEPYMLSGQNLNSIEIKRSGPYSYLNDYRIITETDFTKGGLRQGALFLHWKGLGLGYGRINMWWGDGQHSSIAMTNNTEPFNAYHIGTIKEFRLRNFGFNARYVLSKLNQYDDYRSIYYTALTLGFSYYGETIISVGLSRNYLSGGIETGIPWTQSDASKLIFEGLFVDSKQKLIYTVDGHDPFDQTIEGYFSMTFPESKMKIFLEVGINDHRQNMVDLISQPDHALGYLIGFRNYKMFGNNNLYFGFEYLNLARGKFWNTRTTPDFYYRAHYNHFSYNGRRWGAHSGSDSDDLLIEFGYLNNKFSFIPKFNYERHGITSHQPAEVKIEFGLQASYKINNFHLIFLYEGEDSRHLGFPEDNVYAGELTGQRKIKTAIIRMQYIIR
tara:strand:- start:1490 stop:2974 length:1485 start_codon:yes stop_codon:yes gene_type:complete